MMASGQGRSSSASGDDTSNVSNLLATRNFLRQAMTQLDPMLSGHNAIQSTQPSSSIQHSSPIPRAYSQSSSSSSLQRTSTSSSFQHVQRSIPSCFQQPSHNASQNCGLNFSSRRVQRPSWMTERHNVFGKRGSTKKSKKPKLQMWEHEFICLATCGETIPPSSMDKAELIRAGLGPRKLSMFEYGDSRDFHEYIIGAFPKLKDGGGYELLRTKQHTNRELCVIPPPSGGYTVEFLKNVVSQAKIYIRPIQKDLCLDAQVAETDDDSAPTEKCMKCGDTIPIHQLRQHVTNCSGNNRGNLLDEDDDEFPELPPSFSSRGCREEGVNPRMDTTREQGIPQTSHTSGNERRSSPQSSSCMCASPSPPPYSPIHESSFIDLTSVENDMFDEAVKRSLEKDVGVVVPTDVNDVIVQLQKENHLKIPTTDEEWCDAPRTSIDIRRSKVVQDALREARKTRFDPANLLNVHFVSEQGIDTGGLSREFWRLFCVGITELYCIGEPGQCLLVKNVLALQNEDFKIIGKLIAMSVLQGGCGFPVLLPAAYHYLATGEYLGQVLRDSDVPDIQVRQLLQQIDVVESDKALQFLFDDDNENKGDNDALLLETGFRKPMCDLTCTDKPLIKRAIRDHHTLVKIKPELDQFADGLKSLGVLRKIKAFPSLMAPLFTDQNRKKLSKDYFKALLNSVFSTNDPVRKEKEEAAYIYLMDFIEECEDGTATTDDGTTVTLDLFHWSKS